MFPSEMDTEDVLSLGRAQWDIIAVNRSYLRDLHKVTELMGMTKEVCDSIWHVFKLDKKFRLDLVAVRGGRLVRQKVVDLLVPHAEA